MARKV
jgi:PASTA domain